MDYVCLRFGCTQSATAAGNCPTHGHGALRPVKSWSDYKNSDTLLSLSNFNPSTRRVAFDVHVDFIKHEVYVVLWVNLVFEQGEGDAPAWSSGAKANFKKYLKAGASVLDGQATLRAGHSTNFTPLFFIEFPWLGPHVKITAKTLRQQATRALSVNLLPPNNGVSAGDAEYPRSPPAPSAGTVPGGVACFLSEPAVREFVVGGVECVPFVHELGHMLGLPDEYNAFPPGGGLVPLQQAPNDWNWSTRATFYWVKALQANNLQVPQWGHFGNGLNQVNEHSLMRDVATSPGAILPRHFIPILEGVKHLRANCGGKLLLDNWRLA